MSRGRTFRFPGDPWLPEHDPATGRKVRALLPGHDDYLILVHREPLVSDRHADASLDIARNLCDRTDSDPLDALWVGDQVLAVPSTIADWTVKRAAEDPHVLPGGMRLFAYVYDDLFAEPDDTPEDDEGHWYCRRPEEWWGT